MSILRYIHFVIFLKVVNLVVGDGDDLFLHEGWASLQQTPEKMNCGNFKSSKLSFDGPMITSDDLPWMAKIIRLKKIGRHFEYLKFHCTGSLISHRFVASSASCLKQDRMRIKHVELGESELNQFMKDSQLLNFKYTFDPMRDYFPENIIEHPQYSENPLLYDFGLIKLNKTVTFTDKIYPICLPRHNIYNFMSTFTTAGWEDKKEVSEGIAFPPYGVTDTNPDPLRILHITSSGVEECGVPSHLDLEDNTILCAGDFESKTCQLSGGLPLMEIEDFQGQDKYFLYGVATKFQDGEDCNFRRLFTNTFKYLPFIVDTVVNNTERMNCGRIKPSKITSPVSRGEFPWMAKLIRVDVQDDERHLFFHCIGTLITNQYVITTASCLRDITLSHIELGTSDLEDPLKFGENQLFYNFDPMRVYYYHTISLYEEEGNDLGLIRLTKTVTFTDDISPICLHKDYESESKRFSTFITAGWEFGNFKPSELQKKKVTLDSIEDCERQYLDFTINDNAFCTDDNENIACDLEGGTPLMRVDEFQGEDYYFLHGVSRKLNIINSCGLSKLYTNVYSMVNKQHLLDELPAEFWLQQT